MYLFPPAYLQAKQNHSPPVFPGLLCPAFLYCWLNDLVFPAPNLNSKHNMPFPSFSQMQKKIGRQERKENRVKREVSKHILGKQLVLNKSEVNKLKNPAC